MLTSSVLFSISFVLLAIHSVSSALPTAVSQGLQPLTQSVNHADRGAAIYGNADRAEFTVAATWDHRGSGR